MSRLPAFGKVYPIRVSTELRRSFCELYHNPLVKSCGLPGSQDPTRQINSIAHATIPHSAVHDA